MTTIDKIVTTCAAACGAATTREARWDAIQDAVDAAMAVEREACARILDGMVVTARSHDDEDLASAFEVFALTIRARRGGEAKEA